MKRYEEVRPIALALERIEAELRESMRDARTYRRGWERVEELQWHRERYQRALRLRSGQALERHSREPALARAR